MRTLTTPAWLVVAACLQGCAIGYNSLLLVTGSNVGLNVDAKPPTMELSISRREGVIEPTFEGGRPLPVMASFKVPVNAKFGEPFFFGVSSTFATGEAATIMADLYGNPKPGNLKDHEYKGEVLPCVPDGKTAIQEVPWLRWVVCTALQLDRLVCRPKPLEKNNIRPMFFGTDTILGLKVEWTGETGQYPSSVKFGFNRKEVAWTPVGYTPADDGTAKPAPDVRPRDGNDAACDGRKPVRVGTPSVLAVLDNYSSVGSAPLQMAKNENLETQKAASEQTTDSKGNASKEKPEPMATNFKYLQYFATGRAASYLALQPEVRTAMLARLNPEAAPDIVQQSFATDEYAERLDCWFNGAPDKDEQRRREKLIRTCMPEKMPLTRFIRAAQYLDARKKCINETLKGESVLCTKS